MIHPPSQFTSQRLIGIMSKILLHHSKKNDLVQLNIGFFKRETTTKITKFDFLPPQNKMLVKFNKNEMQVIAIRSRHVK